MGTCKWKVQQPDAVCCWVFKRFCVTVVRAAEARRFEYIKTLNLPDQSNKSSYTCTTRSSFRLASLPASHIDLVRLLVKGRNPRLERRNEPHQESESVM
jgi:hypothetical protein